MQQHTSLPSFSSLETTCQRHRSIRLLASGSFGSVFLVRLSSGDTVIVKSIACVNEEDALHNSEFACLKALRTGRVPHTIHAMGAAWTPLSSLYDCLSLHRPSSEQCGDKEMRLCIVMPLVRGITLRNYLKARAETRAPLSRLCIQDLTAQLVQFSYYAYKHARGLCHNDLKLGNVMVHFPAPDQLSLTVIDFSFATRAFTDSRQYVAQRWRSGTRCYMPPEKLFYDEPPVWLMGDSPMHRSVGDAWAIGTLMATMALTGRRIMKQHPVIVNGTDCCCLDDVFDAQGFFNPSYTDTVYQLLPTTVPWFAELVNIMSCNSGVNPSMLEHGVRLLLWTRAMNCSRSVSERLDFSLPGDEYMPGIEQSPLHRVLDKYTQDICRAYDAAGFLVYEAAWDELKAVLGPALTHLYEITQQWHPRERHHDNDSDHEDGNNCLNPFEWMFRALLPQSVHGLTGVKRAAPHMDSVNDANEGPFSLSLSIDGLLNGIATRPCAVCKAPSAYYAATAEMDRTCSKACAAHLIHSRKTK